MQLQAFSWHLLKKRLVLNCVSIFTSHKPEHNGVFSLDSSTKAANWRTCFWIEMNLGFSINWKLFNYLLNRLYPSPGAAPGFCWAVAAESGGNLIFGFRSEFPARDWKMRNSNRKLILSLIWFDHHWVVSLSSLSLRNTHPHPHPPHLPVQFTVQTVTPARTATFRGIHGNSVFSLNCSLVSRSV